jgi:hypothetical protein
MNPTSLLLTFDKKTSLLSPKTAPNKDLGKKNISPNSIEYVLSSLFFMKKSYVCSKKDSPHSKESKLSSIKDVFIIINNMIEKRTITKRKNLHKSFLVYVKKTKLMPIITGTRPIRALNNIAIRKKGSGKI